MPRKPTLRPQTSTLWYYPSQQYGDTPMGNPAYPGRTPAWVIWNLLTRYTREDDFVLDPFCGGGTTLDVARSIDRRARGFDVEPSRADIERGDARELPVEDATVDFVFMDPPYSTHLTYDGRAEDDAVSDPDAADGQAQGIGALDAFEPGYFEAMDTCFGEAYRVLRDRRYLAVYVSDSFKKKRGFVAIGARFFELCARRFRPVDHIAVVRGNRKLEDPRFHKAAAEGNFFLRGFNHLLIFKKEVDVESGPQRKPKQRRGPGRRG